MEGYALQQVFRALLDKGTAALPLVGVAILFWFLREGMAVAKGHVSSSSKERADLLQFIRDDNARRDIRQAASLDFMAQQTKAMEQISERLSTHERQDELRHDAVTAKLNKINDDVLRARGPNGAA